MRILYHVMSAPAPLGLVFLAITERGLRYVKFMDKRSLKRMVADHSAENPGATWEHSVTDLRPIADQFDEYFTGTRTHIRVPLDPVGSEFQMQVWRALLDVPFGQTRNYGEIARAIGQPNAARAVGLAANQNPLCIVVPCHRVIGADGKLVGYAGGVTRKKALLTLEAHFGKLDPLDLNRVIASAKVKVDREPETGRTVKRPPKSTSKPTPRPKVVARKKSALSKVGRTATGAGATRRSTAVAASASPRSTKRVTTKGASGTRPTKRST